MPVNRVSMCVHLLGLASKERVRLGGAALQTEAMRGGLLGAPKKRQVPVSMPGTTLPCPCPCQCAWLPGRGTPSASLFRLLGPLPSPSERAATARHSKKCLLGFSQEPG